MKTNFNHMKNNQLEHLLDGVFNRSISEITGTDFIATHPTVNILEREDRYTIQLAAPGLTKPDFNIKIEKDQLVISVSKEKSDSGPKFTRREYNYSAFTRSFSLDKTIDTNSIKAAYTDGILTIELNKKEEAKENGPQFINID